MVAACALQATSRLAKIGLQLYGSGALSRSHVPFKLFVSRNVAVGQAFTRFGLPVRASVFDGPFGVVACHSINQLGRATECSQFSIRIEVGVTEEDIALRTE